MILHTLVGRCTTKLQKQNTLEFGRLYTKRFAYCWGLFVRLNVLFVPSLSIFVFVSVMDFPFHVFLKYNYTC